MLKKVSPKTLRESAQYDGTSISLEDLYLCASAAKSLKFNYYRQFKNTHNGLHGSRIRGRGMEFDQVRVYQTGDDIRNIDWRVTARTQKTHTKLYQEERERPVFCLVDYTSSMYFGTRHVFKSVIAAKIAATIAWIAIQGGDRLGGIVFTEDEFYETRPQAKHRGLMPFLNDLASTEIATFTPAAPHHAFAKALQRLRHVVKPGSLVFIMSDFMDYDDQAQKHLAHITRHAECFACRITDPLELELPPANYYLVGNDQDQLSIDTSSQPLRENFRKSQESLFYDVKKSLYHCRIPLLEFSTLHDPIKILQQVFGKNVQSRMIP